MKKFHIWRAGILMALLLSATGCGRLSLPEAYSFEEGEARLAEDSVSLPVIPLFASELCVIRDGAGETDETVTAEAGGLFNLTDQTVTYSKNPYEKMYPASTTKVMTAILAIEAIENKELDLDEMVTVTQDAVITEAGASLCGIKPGDRIAFRDLLYGLMMPSGNDAANAIAVHMSGSVGKFSERMNQRAAELGATHTHFMNPSGLSDDDHYTTAYDLYLIFNEARKHTLFREIIGTSSYTADYTDQAGTPVSKTWTVGNWYQKGEREAPEGVTVLGGKTGTTQAAGYCLIMLSDDSKGREYISVVLKADSRPALYDNMTNIISKIVN